LHTHERVLTYERMYVTT